MSTLDRKQKQNHKRFFNKKAARRNKSRPLLTKTKQKSQPISRVLSSVAIYLRLPLPTNSSDVLRPFHDKRPYFGTILSCFGWGLHSAVRYRTVGGLLPRLFTLTHGYKRRMRYFLLHFPGSYLRRTLSVTLLCEARTFLVGDLIAPAAT